MDESDRSMNMNNRSERVDYQNNKKQKVFELYQYVVVNLNKTMNKQTQNEIQEVFDNRMEFNQCIQNLY